MFSCSHNFGLLDVEAAIKWIHANIANFGGDPDRIILFGQSAGAAATDAYIFSHPQDTIVKGIIQESGSITGIAGLLSSPTNNSVWNSIAATVGCGSAPTSEQFSCMQRAPAHTLEAAVTRANIFLDLVADNVTVFADVQARAINGDFLHVPLLGGTTLNEDDIFTVAGELATTGFAKPVITELISDIQTLTLWTCPAGEAALFRINANVPTWRYQYQAIFAGISTRQDMRCFHSVEIPMVFGTYNISISNPSSTVIALSRYVQSAWVAFARDPKQGLIDFGWPSYNPNTTSLAQLGGVLNQTGVVFTQGSVIDSPCANQAALVEIQDQFSNLLGV